MTYRTPLAPRPARFALAGIVSLLAVMLAACSNGPGADVGSRPVVAQLNIPVEVALVTLEVNGDTFDVEHDGSGTATFELDDVPFGTTTFEARAFDALVDGIVLYDGVTTVDVTADTESVDLAMARTISGLSVTATSASPIAAGEVVTATVAGLTQMLTVSVDGTSATGELPGIPTGRGLTVTVESRSGGVLVRQGSADVNLSEDVEPVAVTLTALGSNAAPDVPVFSGIPAELEQGDLLELGVGVSDPDGNLASVSIGWGDGSSADVASVSGASDSVTFQHTYTTTGTQTITVTVVDGEGLSSQASEPVEIVAPPAGGDISVVVDVEPDLSTVSVTATGAPPAADAVLARITPSGAADAFDLGLVPQGADEWSASLALRQGQSYDLEFVALTGGVESLGNAYDVTPDAATYAVTEAFGDGVEPTTAIVPMSTTCSADTPVTGTCEVSVHLVGFDAEFFAYQFDFELANGSYEIDTDASGPASRTSGFGFGAISDTTAAGLEGLEGTPAVGSGEIYVLVLDRLAVDSDTLTTSAGEITVAGGAPLGSLPGDAIALP